MLAGAIHTKRRRCADNAMGEGDRVSSSVGAFTQGGVGGLLRGTRQYPWTTQLLVSVVRGVCLNHQFSSVAIHKNSSMELHVDGNNAPQSMNLLIPCSRWRGGGVWTTDSSASKTIPVEDQVGAVHSVHWPYILLGPWYIAWYSDLARRQDTHGGLFGEALASPQVRRPHNTGKCRIPNTSGETLQRIETGIQPERSASSQRLSRHMICSATPSSESQSSRELVTVVAPLDDEVESL